MMLYSIQLRDRIFVNDYGFLSFAKNMDKNICKYISKILCGKHSQSFLTMLNNLPQMSLKLLQIEHFKKMQKQLVI